MAEGKRKRVVLDVRWTRESKAIIRQLEKATETLKRLGQKGLSVMVATGKGRRRRPVKLTGA